MVAPRLRAGLAIVALLAASHSIVAGQQATGELSGRILDTAGGPLPGVTITAVLGSARHKTVTDAGGRFALNGLEPGMYDVTAELSGFVTRSGRVRLALVNTRAYVEWSLRIGCLAQVQRVQFNAQDAARMADAIIRLRITRSDGEVNWITEPGCPSRWRDFAAESTHVVAGKVDSQTKDVRLFVRPDSGDATVGRDYLAILSETTPGSGVWYADARHLLPIDGDRVAAPGEPALDGRTVRDAEALLREWFARRPNRLR